MARVTAEESAVVAAPPDRVYAIFADYRGEHPQVLPQPPFGPLEVEEGGHGAGTVFRTSVRVMGVEQRFRMAVTEPEPGRRLVETDLATGLTTSFTLTPAGGGQQTRVRIATEWESQPGLAGLLERLTTPMVMRSIYRRQLAKLAAYLGASLG